MKTVFRFITMQIVIPALFPPWVKLTYIYYSYIFGKCEHILNFF